MNNSFFFLLVCSQAPPGQCWVIVIIETDNIHGAVAMYQAWLNLPPWGNGVEWITALPQVSISYSLEPTNITLWQKKDSYYIENFELGRYVELSRWVLNATTSVLMGENEREILHREEIKALWPQRQRWSAETTSQEKTAAIRSWKKQGGYMVLLHLNFGPAKWISDFWLPELSENEFLLL